MSNLQKGKVFVAMSGGVDSSVAALLLKKQGYDVTGVFMRCFNLDGCSERDAEDARRVAEHLGIPFYVFDFEDEYKRDVVEYMVDGYKKGITPNPDVMCNKYVKFGLFLKRALALGADYIATGHYVKVKKSKIVPSGHLPQGDKNQNVYRLCEAKDKNKDQSYFLWTLTQKELKHCLFPIGGYIKPQVREIAKKTGLPTAEKKDSQGVCFLGKVSIHNFLKQYISETPGEVITTEGKKIGEHGGAQFYTIGQRHLGISNIKYQKSKNRESRKPHYVVSKDIKTNTLVVAEGDGNPALFKKEVVLRNVNFVSPLSIIPAFAQLRTDRHNSKFIIHVLARVRYRQPLVSAHLYLIHNTCYKLLFDVPVKYVAPGQSAVFYSDKGELLGGGIIE